MATCLMESLITSFLNNFEIMMQALALILMLLDVMLKYMYIAFKMAQASPNVFYKYSNNWRNGQQRANTHLIQCSAVVTNKEICFVRIVFAYAYSVVLFCLLSY